MHESSLAAAGLAAVLILSACASDPPVPIAGMTAARSAIGEAEKAEAGRYAAPELSEAREKLALADAAVAKKSMPSAERFADQARIEADLATAKTAQVKAAAVDSEMKHGNEALIDEMQRKSGTQQ